MGVINKKDLYIVSDVPQNKFNKECILKRGDDDTQAKEKEMYFDMIKFKSESLEKLHLYSYGEKVTSIDIDEYKTSVELEVLKAFL